MKITREKLIELEACEPSIPWFDEHGCEDLLTTLLTVNKYNPAWARWLFTRLMNQRQRVRISIFCAEKVIGIFEAKHPDDKRPRVAIRATMAWLENPTEENRRAAYAAAAAAAAAAAYAASDAAAAAATAAAYAAYAASNAAASDAAYAAYAASNAAAYARLKLQEEIIHEAVRILDAGETK